MLLTSWKSISKACDGCSVSTLKRWMKKYGMPVRYIGRKPTITEEALREWWGSLPDEIKH